VSCNSYRIRIKLEIIKNIFYFVFNVQNLQSLYRRRWTHRDGFLPTVVPSPRTYGQRVPVGAAVASCRWSLNPVTDTDLGGGRPRQPTWRRRLTSQRPTSWHTIFRQFGWRGARNIIRINMID